MMANGKKEEKGEEKPKAEKAETNESMGIMDKIKKLFGRGE